MPRRFLTVPHQPQRLESDCLAACAWMVLAAAGAAADYDMLLAALNIKPWGTPHRNIRQLEELIDRIQVTYRQGVLADVFHALDEGQPVILFVWTGDLPYWALETWHAVVVVGYDEDHFYLNDPAFPTAPQVVTHGDLAYCLTFPLGTTLPVYLFLAAAGLFWMIWHLLIARMLWQRAKQ